MKDNKVQPSYSRIINRSVYFKSDVITDFFKQIEIKTGSPLSQKKQRDIVKGLFKKSVYKRRLNDESDQGTFSIVNFKVVYEYFIFQFIITRNIGCEDNLNKSKKWCLEGINIKESVDSDLRLKFQANSRALNIFKSAYYQKYSSQQFLPDNWLNTLVRWIKTSTLKKVIYIKGHFRFIFEKEKELMSFIVAENNIQSQWEIIGCRKINRPFSFLRTHLA